MASTEQIILSDLAHARVSGYEEDGRSRAYGRQTRSDQNTIEQASLPRVDGGKAAWLFLAGCFAIEALTWGKSCHFPFNNVKIHFLTLVYHFGT